MIQQAKFAYSPLEKAFGKQTKTIEDQEKKQVIALEVLKPEKNKEDIKLILGLFRKEVRTNEIKNKLDKIKKWEDKLNEKI